MSNKPEQASFFNDAISAYGFDGARELGQTIINSFAESQQRLPLLRPVSGVRLMVMPLSTGYPHQAYALGREGIIEIAFNTGANLEDLLAIVPETVEHEVAHVAHAQLNPELFLRPEESLFLFTAAVIEGVAEEAAARREPKYDPQEYINCFNDYELEVMVDGVFDALRFPAEGQRERHHAYLFGTEDFPREGYMVGHLVVAAMAAERECDLKELMCLPLEDYVELAERICEQTA